MKRFRESLILKVIALVLVATFASQQVCFAEKVDLREEGEIGALDVVLALVSGILQGLMVNPSWSAFQTFAMCYLVPRGTSLLCDAAGIKNPYLRAAIETGISAGVGAAIDTSAASKAAKAGTTAAATTGKYASIATKIKGFFSKIGSGASGAAKAGSNLANAGARAVAGTSASLFTVALIKGAQGAIYGVARTYLYENIKKYDKRLAIFVSEIGAAIVSELAEAAFSKASGVIFSYDKYGRLAVKPTGGTLTLNRYLNLQLLNFLTKELPAQVVAGGIEVALAEAGMSEEGIRGIGGFVSSIVSSLLAKGGKFFKDYEGKNLEQLKESREEIQAKLDADQLAAEKGQRDKMLNLHDYEELQGRLRAIDVLMELRTYQKNLSVYKSLPADYANEYVRLQGKDYRKEAMTMDEMIMYEDMYTYLGENVPGSINPGPVIGGPEKGAEVDDQNGELDGKMVKRYHALINNTEADIKEAKGGLWTILINAAIAGAASAGLQYISKQTPSAMHGAVFNLFATSLLKALLTRGPVFALVGSAATEAVADTMSMGRAGARLNTNISTLSQSSNFDLDWRNTDDSFVYLPRLYTYIQDMDQYGMGEALMNQFMSSMHYVSVKNVTETVMDQIYGREHIYYLQIARPAWSDWGAANKATIEAAQKADAVRSVADLTKGSTVIDYEGETGTVIENKDGQITVKWDSEDLKTDTYTSDQTIGDVFSDASFKGSYSGETAKVYGWRNYIPWNSPFSGMEKVKEQLEIKSASGTLSPEELNLLQSLGGSLDYEKQDILAWSAPGHRGRYKEMTSYFNEADLSNPALRSLPAIQAAREEQKETYVNLMLKAEKGEIRDEIYKNEMAALAPQIDKLKASIDPNKLAQIDSVYDPERYRLLNSQEESQFANPSGDDTVSPSIKQKLDVINQKLADNEDKRIQAYRQAATPEARNEYDQAAKQVERDIPRKVAESRMRQAERKAEQALNAMYMKSLAVVHDLMGDSTEYLSSLGNKQPSYSGTYTPPPKPVAAENKSEPPAKAPEGITEIAFPPITEEAPAEPAILAPEVKAAPAATPAPASTSATELKNVNQGMQEIDFTPALKGRENPGNPVILVDPRTLKDITVADLNPDNYKPVLDLSPKKPVKAPDVTAEYNPQTDSWTVKSQELERMKKDGVTGKGDTATKPKPQPVLDLSSFYGTNAPAPEQPAQRAQEGVAPEPEINKPTVTIKTPALDRLADQKIQRTTGEMLAPSSTPGRTQLPAEPVPAEVNALPAPTAPIPDSNSTAAPRVPGTEATPAPALVKEAVAVPERLGVFRDPPALTKANTNTPAAVVPPTPAAEPVSNAAAAPPPAIDEEEAARQAESVSRYGRQISDTMEDVGAIAQGGLKKIDQAIATAEQNLKGVGDSAIGYGKDKAQELLSAANTGMEKAKNSLDQLPQQNTQEVTLDKDAQRALDEGKVFNDRSQEFLNNLRKRQELMDKLPALDAELKKRNYLNCDDILAEKQKILDAVQAIPLEVTQRAPVAQSSIPAPAVLVSEPLAKPQISAGEAQKPVQVDIKSNIDKNQEFLDNMARITELRNKLPALDAELKKRNYLNCDDVFAEKDRILKEIAAIPIGVPGQSSATPVVPQTANLASPVSKQAAVPASTPVAVPAPVSVPAPVPAIQGVSPAVTAPMQPQIPQQPSPRQSEPVAVPAAESHPLSETSLLSEQDVFSKVPAPKTMSKAQLLKVTKAIEVLETDSADDSAKKVAIDTLLNEYNFKSFTKPGEIKEAYKVFMPIAVREAIDRKLLVAEAPISSKDLLKMGLPEASKLSNDAIIQSAVVARQIVAEGANRDRIEAFVKATGINASGQTVLRGTNGVQVAMNYIGQILAEADKRQSAGNIKLPDYKPNPSPKK